MLTRATAQYLYTTHVTTPLAKLSNLILYAQPFSEFIAQPPLCGTVLHVILKISVYIARKLSENKMKQNITNETFNGTYNVKSLNK